MVLSLHKQPFWHCTFSIYHCTFCASLRIKKCPGRSWRTQHCSI